MREHGLPTVRVSVPAFGRLDEFVGAWAYEPTRFAAQFAAIAGVDLGGHEPPRPKSQLEKVPARNGAAVAVVRLAGTMMKQASSMGGASTVQARRDLRQAAADPDVSGILLAIDSPGGTVAGTMDLAAEVDAARKRKPVWGHVDDLCASAAMWVGARCDQLFANAPTALVGSIGTMIVVHDLSGMAEKEGVKVFAFTTGPLKAAGVPGTALTEGQQADLQGLVESLQQHFDEGVRSGRHLTAKQLEAVRTGGVFTARAAVGLRLIDGIQSFEATLQGLARAK